MLNDDAAPSDSQGTKDGPPRELGPESDAFWAKVHDLQGQWEEVWGADRAKYADDYPKWMLDAATELFAHDLCDAWVWKDYVKAACVIMARHFAGAAPSLNSVDTPAPVPERTNWRKEFPCSVIHMDYPKDSTCLDQRAWAINNEPPYKYGEELRQRYIDYDRTLICNDCWAVVNLELMPPARKDELGTCDYLMSEEHELDEHPKMTNGRWIWDGIKVPGICQHWKPVAPQASLKHDLRKQDTPESKEHWDFVAEATARVEAMPEWKKNSVAVGGSPEAPAKEERTEFEAYVTKTFIGFYTEEPISFELKGNGYYKVLPVQTAWMAWQERARLGLSGRAE